MVTATKKRPEPTPDREPMFDRSGTCEQQLAADRQRAQEVLTSLGAGITKWNENGWQWRPGEGGLHKVMVRLAQLSWLEHRLTMIETGTTPLWCPECQPAQDFPGTPWMVFHCLDHAGDMNERTALSYGRSLFGGES